MIELQPKNLLSGNYLAVERGVVIAELSPSLWRSRGEITVQGRRLKLEQSGAAGALALRDGDIVVATMTRPSAWRSKLVFQFGGGELEVVERAWYSSTRLVRSGGVVVGRIRARGFWAGGVVVELPEVVPVALRLLIGWVVVSQDVAVALAAGG